MRKLFSVVVACLAMLTGSLVAAVPAQADARCSYTTCRNLDPTAMGCHSDARTIYRFDNKEVRWSYACQAAWMRSTTGSHIMGFDTDVTMRVFPSIAGGTPHNVHSWSRTGSKITTMVGMTTHQFMQVEIRDSYYPRYTPMLNTVAV